MPRSPFSAVRSSGEQSRNTGVFRALRRKSRRLSAFQTAWRRERDSNPRYGFPYIGFQDRLFQPLTHPSARSGLGSTFPWLVYNTHGMAKSVVLPDIFRLALVYFRPNARE